MVDWPLIGQIWPADQEFTGLARTSVDASRRVWGQLAHLRCMSGFSADGLERMLTTSELADYLHVSRQVIYDLRHDGRGPRGIHVGKELRYSVSEIRSWMERRSDPVTPEVHHVR